MKIYLATDHAGFAHKEFLKKYFEEENSRGHLYEVLDFGAYAYDSDDDYPLPIHDMMHAILIDWKLGLNSRAIIFGGSGQGEAMVANRYIGARTTVYYGGNLDIVKLGREHNNANILSIGARFVDVKELVQAIEIFLNSSFTNEDRHVRRIEEIDMELKR